MIDEKLIPKIEKAFGFPLYDWQKKYLLGKGREFPKERASGKTFAYILNLLLSDGEQIKAIGVRPMWRSILFEMYDECHGEPYKKWFFRKCMEISQMLVENGIKTRII